MVEVNVITKDMEDFASDFVTNRCNEIEEMLYDDCEDIQIILKKLKNTPKNTNEFYNLNSELQNVTEKKIYVQGLKDGIGIFSLIYK
jgi:predicted nuclease of restriction endonuclease-like RecB superfamily